MNFGIKLIAAIAGVTMTMALPSFSADQNYHDPGMKKIAQIAFVCRDIEASSKRWAAILGMEIPKIITTKPGKEVQMIYRGKPSNGQVKLAFFSAGQVVVELLQPLGGDSSWQEGLDKNGEGLHHLGFQVIDPEKTVKSMEAQGFPVVHQGRYDNNDGTYIYMDTQKALGVLVELLHSDKPAK
jgi:catechol 2,3-dioxygenase-like lactoylglutathione lyase family enzyme